MLVLAGDSTNSHESAMLMRFPWKVTEITGDTVVAEERVHSHTQRGNHQDSYVAHHDAAVSACGLSSQHGMTAQPKTHASLSISSWLRKGAVGCANSQHIATVKISCGTYNA